MEKNEWSVSRYLIMKLLDELKEAMLEKQDRRIEELQKELNEEYQYYRTLN